MTLWIAHIEDLGKAERTVSAYAADLRDFAAWYHDSFGEDVDVGSILGRDIEDYKSYLQTVRRVSPRTVNRRLAALSRFFKWAVARDFVRRDPTADVRSVRLPRRRPKALTPREQRRLLHAVHRAENLRDIAMIEVLLGTGTRAGELLALRRGDLTLNPRSGDLLVRRAKGGSARNVPLRAKVRRAVQDYLEHLGEDLRDEDPLWYGIRGPLKDPSAINRIVAKYGLLVGIEDLTPHTLRHTFATRYLEANPGDVRGLASLLGHARLDTVMIYTEPTDEDLLERLERMEQAEAVNG